MKKIKVGVIGVGLMGQNHARVYSELPRCQLVAVSDLDEEKTKTVSRKFNCRHYRDHMDMIEKEDIQAVSIAVPTKNHKEVALDAIKKNLNILLEKPISNNIKDSEEIIKNVKEHNVKLLVGHIERFNPAVTKLKEMIDQRKLGDICSIMAKRVGLFPPRIKDANIVIDVSVHDIDIIRYIMGGDPDDVYACGGKTINDEREDQVVAILKYGNTNGIIQSNWITPIKIRNLSVTGVKGYAELNYITQELILYENNYIKTFDDYGDFMIKFGKLNKINVDVKFNEPLKVEIEHFLECIRDNKEPLVNGNEALATLKVAIDINKKLEEKK